MIIGHLPAGYLAATAARRRLGLSPQRARALLAVALVASVAPDIDLLAFVATGGHVHHHAYPTHWPIFWLASGAAGFVVAGLRRSRALALGVAAATSAALLHLALDSVAGAIRWGAPFSDRATTLVRVPASDGPWLLSMMSHWTFGVEIALTVVAAAVWWRRRAVRRASGRPAPPRAGA